MITIIINGEAVEADPNDTILKAAKSADIYIPTLCHHPDLPPRKGGRPVPFVYQGDRRVENDPSKTPSDGLESGCGLCVVEMADSGELKPACLTLAAEGMAVITDSEKVKIRRQEKLAKILADHPHACLTCAQREGCPRTQCSLNVPEQERCCPKLGNCELQKVAEYVGIPPSTPRWVHADLPVLADEPLFTRTYSLCIGCTRCVRACRDLRGVEAIGFVVDAGGKVTVGSVAPTLKESGCRFCTACVEVCPTGAIMDRDLKSSEEDLLPCTAACPAGINIPWHLRLLAQGRADDALSVIREKVPFPGILGRVCVRPCEEACRGGAVNERISICALKRFAADNGGDAWKTASVQAADSGRKVAVIGAGPGGLAAAYYLRKQGHGVTVFDSNEKAGGMMRYGIPEYRLPTDVLDREIGEILSLGVEFRPNTPIGADVTLARLREDFDAVFIAAGASMSRKISAHGVTLPGVLWGLDFLRETRVTGGARLSGSVVAIGGGSVAVDAALTARRLAANQVQIVCLEDRDEMPARPWEIRRAEEEGVVIHNCWGLLDIVEHGGRVRGICFKRCECVFDKDGVFDPHYDNECQMGLDADTVILAVGQTSDLRFAVDAGVTVTHNVVAVDSNTLQTNLPGVYAGGDAVVFPGTIVHAVAAGLRAAREIDRYLDGSGRIEETLVALPRLNPRLGRDEGFAFRKRAATRAVPVQEREGFQEVDLGFEAGDAAREASRCLQCDLRLAMAKVEFPPEHVRAFTEASVENVPEADGVVRLLDESKKPILIKGTSNMRALLLEQLQSNEDAKFFDFEEDRLFSKRESELIEQHLQKYGEMPRSAEEDDLY